MAEALADVGARESSHTARLEERWAELVPLLQPYSRINLSNTTNKECCCDRFPMNR